MEINETQSYLPEQTLARLVKGGKLDINKGFQDTALLTWQLFSLKLTSKILFDSGK